MYADYTEIESEEFLTFDDVQIAPKYSEIKSRSDCSVATKFTKNHIIKCPLIASPMNTVCETKMAVAMHKAGGIGIFHRFLSIAEQSKMIELFRAHFVSVDNSAIACAAVGVKEEDKKRSDHLISYGVEVILIDVAHGHHANVRDMIKWLKENHPKIDVIAGNVATSEGAEDLWQWGADAIRVGVGGGSVCETRIRTGIGIPQLSAIIECSEAVHGMIPIIADGGIRYPGDVAKALAAGESSVMIGSLFAGTNEAPGEILVAGKWPYVRHQKIYRGSASASAKLEQFGQANHVEGATKIIDAKGPVNDIINDVIDGVTSCMSYVGAKNIAELQANAEFIKITQSGLIEAHPHLL